MARSPYTRTRKTDRPSGGPPSLSNADSFLANKVTQLDSDYKHLSETFESHQNSVYRRFDSLEKLMKDLYDKFNSKNQVNWPLIVSVIVAGVVVFGAITQTIMAPVQGRLAYFDVQIDKMENRASENRSGAISALQQINIMENKFNEIETRFTAQSQVTNLQLQKDRQVLWVLWQKSFPFVELPDDDYYPVIGNEK